MPDPQTDPTLENARGWQPLSRTERRVAGVLAEKAKTTPENYPLSLNGLVNGCNQKNNRFPQMQLDQADVEEALQRLRAAGAAAQVEGSGRVDKHRHLLYDWLSVDKLELAVMAELLLRGAQTLGELRGRAARMESISSIADLRPIIDRLSQKGLVVFLTPAGRGAVVAHALYQPQEMEKIRAEFGTAATSERVSSAGAARSRVRRAGTGLAESGLAESGLAESTGPAAPVPDAAELNRAELESLQAEVARLVGQVTDLRSEVELLKEQLN